MSSTDDEPFDATDADRTNGADGADDRPTALSPLPFVVALILFLVVGGLALVFLREDSPGRLFSADQIAAVADDQLEVTSFGPFDGPAEVVQIGYAIGDDVIYVELVIDVDGCDDGDDSCEAANSATAVLELPSPIDGRSLEAGTGRALADCVASDDGGTVVCRP